MMLPVRGDVSGFGATLKATVPPPSPLPPAVIVIQSTALWAVHSHPAPAVTLVVPVPPPAATYWPTGAIAYVHDPPAWVTTKTCPPTEIVPVREDPPVFGATLNATVPGPEPLAAPAIVIHAVLLDAVHAQPAPVVIETVPLPPVTGTDWLEGDRLAVHDAPACVTVKV